MDIVRQRHVEIRRDLDLARIHLAPNQRFVDGNKRTGLAAALVFLDLNGITTADPEERLYDGMISVAERRLDKAGLAALICELAVP